MAEMGAGGSLYFLFGYALTYGGNPEKHNGFIGELPGNMPE
jgi:hypothetical protein